MAGLLREVIGAKNWVDCNTWAHAGAISSVPAKTAEEIPQDDYRDGSLKETPTLWTSTWSHSEGRKKEVGECGTTGI